MEDVLDIYGRPYDKDIPVVCMDEQPVQFLKEIYAPIEATKNHPKRVDYEYERNGTASVFMFCEALAGHRTVTVRPQRKKVDWATELKQLIDERYSECEKVILVCDNLNTHTKGAFYEAFPPDEAKKVADKVEIHHTPKHGSWLNIAECELSAMTRQCISNRRIPDIATLSKEVACWAYKTNQKQRGVDWQFSIDKARNKLKSIYPKILE